ncbi:hypothetical protein VTK73DRAFT_2629 [Phialemonium thermophilum]|uniref:Uncharacterized protein n=1 Tax=Phialemonium thermophilum TaxID=223376 RepID=A0ABR3X470_9PEZI
MSGSNAATKGNDDGPSSLPSTQPTSSPSADAQPSHPPPPAQGAALPTLLQPTPSAPDTQAPAWSAPPLPPPAVQMAVDPPELDDFGLPVRRYQAPITDDAAGPRSSSSASAASKTRKSQSQCTTRRSEVEGEEPLTPDVRVEEAETSAEDGQSRTRSSTSNTVPARLAPPPEQFEDKAISDAKKSPTAALHGHGSAAVDLAGGGVSEFSHQQFIPQGPTGKKAGDDDDEWQEMPAFAPYDIYDDDNRLIAREHHETADEAYGYAGLGGAGKGYTRVQLDDDVESATSMDENTQYLFKDAGQSTSMMDDEETQRDAVSQLQATKTLLTEGQRIAYVGLTRLELSGMIKDAERIPRLKRSKKEAQIAIESMKMWSQKMMIRLYTHMDISPAEQIMIEQLSDHGVVPKDLTPILMANARVKNPMAESRSKRGSVAGQKSPSSRPSSVASPKLGEIEDDNHHKYDEEVASPPPAYSAEVSGGELSVPVRTPSQLPTTDKIDIDLRWTVLCDLFLVLIADSIYDARSRVLLERVGKDLEIPWLDIYRFEKKVTDALEMQQNAEKENWNEEQHMENRRKMALKRRYVMMGLATVGGGLVIGLSAGLLAPMIGAGLAAGFTTIGVTGTSGFLAGTGGAAIITSSAAASGSIIGVRAANRRTGAVRTFEYRPLHNNKRVNLIVTVSGWMTGKVDDVRLPYSTVDPMMGDIYSVLWEPEMLTSMGDTINILATEALTQGLQQLLGSTILVSLMAALQLPVVLTKLAYLIDNPWAVSLDRATAAGLILADSLIDRNLGTRPVTLVGYSLGSRVIFSCLQELARKGAYGLVQNVYLFGSPVVVKQDEYLRARTVVSGVFVNGYNRNDWILGYLFRLTNGGIRRVAGLAPIEGVPGLDNMDVTEWVKGHMEYRKAMPRLLRECGWLVESDEFSEIEDPDPENHAQRQRELINEIEEARKELEKEGKGGKSGPFAFFGRRKKARQRQEWEVYEDAAKGKPGSDGGDRNGESNQGVLFDVDAIRAELAKERQQTGGGIDPLDEELLQVREIKSTLPPMKLDLSASPSLAAPEPTRSPRDSLRATQSDVSVPYRPSHEPRLSRNDKLPQDRRLSGTVSSESASWGEPQAGNSHHYDDLEPNTPRPRHEGGQNEDEIQMTFDTSFEETTPSPQPPQPPPKDDYCGTTHPSLSTRSLGAGSGPSAVETTASKTALVRPDIKTVQTAPNVSIQDPWVDEDDEDFGKEKEISLTFA